MSEPLYRTFVPFQVLLSWGSTGLRGGVYSFGGWGWGWGCSIRSTPQTRALPLLHPRETTCCLLSGRKHVHHPRASSRLSKPARLSPDAPSQVHMGALLPELLRHRPFCQWPIRLRMEGAFPGQQQLVMRTRGSEQGRAPARARKSARQNRLQEVSSAAIVAPVGPWG